MGCLAASQASAREIPVTPHSRDNRKYPQMIPVGKNCPQLRAISLKIRQNSRTLKIDVQTEAVRV